MVGRFALGSAVALMPGFAAAAPKLDAVAVQLFYATSGTLSGNIASPVQFSGWNTPTGAGDAKEPANDILVTARLSVPGDEANSSTPLTLKVVGAGGKILAQRTVKSIFFKAGRSVQALYVPDAACAGHLDVTAQFGAQRKAASVTLDCGE